MDRRRRRSSLLDQMQLVAEEQDAENLGRSFDGDDHDMTTNIDLDHPGLTAGYNLPRRSSVRLVEGGIFAGDSGDEDSDEGDEMEEEEEDSSDVDGGIHGTIYEGEDETTEEGDEEDGGLSTGASALGPLYEDGEEQGEEGSMSLHVTEDAAFYYGEDHVNHNHGGANNEPDSPPPGYAKRSSFSAMRRSVHSTESGHSNDSSSQQLSVSSLPSAPVSADMMMDAGADGGMGGGGGGVRPRRYGSGSEIIFSSSGTSSGGGGGNMRASNNNTKRRSNFYRQSIMASSTSVLESDDTNTGNESPRRGGRRGMFTSRRSSRRRSSNRSSSVDGGASSNGGSSTSTANLDIATAVDRLGSSVGDNNYMDGGGNNWDHTIAAAAIVAATTNAPGNKRQVRQYNSGDHVLVLLNLLNLQNRQLDDPDDFSICPVNEMGYPQGVGKTEEQKRGPFNLLLCTVTVVHFDEDERYYTVRRCDTNSEQRGDPSVMYPLTDEAGIQAAYKAAKRTRRHEAEMSTLNVQNRGGPLQQCCRSLQEWPVQFYKKTLTPLYLSTRASIKVVAGRVLHGDHGYAFKIRLTGINLLVVCSFIYLFNDVFNLAFLDSSDDYASAVLGLVVWIILFLELLFEGLVRPDNYHQLKTSDKAYAPSTARNINAFHLCFESAALFLYIPNFPCIVNRERCGDDTFFGAIYASLKAATSDNWAESAFGRLILGLTFLRVFGLVRHWKQMWLSNIFENDNSNSQVVRRLLLLGGDSKQSRTRAVFRLSKKKKKQDQDDDSVDDDDNNNKNKGNPNSSSPSSRKIVDEDQDLKNAANIGTALMIVNSHRVLLLLLVIGVVFPAIYSLQSGNPVNQQMVELLNGNNVVANDTTYCDYLYTAVKGWLDAESEIHTHQRYILGEVDSKNLIWAQLLPVRCSSWQRADGVITDCDYVNIDNSASCSLWQDSPGPDEASSQYFSDRLDLRVGELQVYTNSMYADFNTSGNRTQYFVKSINDVSIAVTATYRSMFLLQISLLMAVLYGLTVMRGDAGRLVLDPLQRMLKIVVRYAENPLSQSLGSSSSSSKKKSPPTSSTRKERDGSAEQLGSYETDQLINAIAKIADLLRKCWGVAGAGIISSNLARTKDGKTVMFNPTIPGKRVYALFGFVAIREFDMLLRALDRDVMVLINDVAGVVHDEVYRWSLGDSGQCNKNLGAAFLMVFRIGDFSEVHDRKKKATDVVFNSNLRNVKVKKRRGSDGNDNLKGSARRPTMTKFELGANGTLQLASLPGIQSFTDRALLGLLKSFAGILRDEKIVRWKKDLRLGAGVGAFSVGIIYGMDAGWAVEGAVGSQYKIDATYLSPHVNMASRMMSASKQYGVTILLSQAIEELLSKPAQNKLRHLDTVIVKGASRPQRIFTYDARAEGADFFLFDRTKDQADVDAFSYSPTVWETDQDLKAMRQHVSDSFMKQFKRGVDLYSAGEWKTAITVLKEADNMMIRDVIEEGYVDQDVSEYGEAIFDSNSEDEEIVALRDQYGDGACKNLVQYMERRNGTPPPDWRGFRALMSK